jgi:hypothetical protein
LHGAKFLKKTFSKNKIKLSAVPGLLAKIYLAFSFNEAIEKKIHVETPYPVSFH